MLRGFLFWNFEGKPKLDFFFPLARFIFFRKAFRQLSPSVEVFMCNAFVEWHRWITCINGNLCFHRTLVLPKLDIFLSSFWAVTRNLCPGSRSRKTKCCLLPPQRSPLHLLAALGQADAIESTPTQVLLFKLIWCPHNRTHCNAAHAYRDDRSSSFWSMATSTAERLFVNLVCSVFDFILNLLGWVGFGQGLADRWWIGAQK